MPWFLCEYPAWPESQRVRGDCLPGNYSSFIWADSMRQAKNIADYRNIGEVVVCLWMRVRGGSRMRPYDRPSDQLRKRLSASAKLDVIHGVCFLSYLLQRCNGAPPEGILGDEGILHQVIHSLSYGYPRREALIKRMRHFERMVPGYWP